MLTGLFAGCLCACSVLLPWGGYAGGPECADGDPCGAPVDGSAGTTEESLDTGNDSTDADVSEVSTPGSIVFHGESQSSSWSLDLPPNTVQGDLLLAGLALGNVSATGGPGNPQAPAGWTLLDNVVIPPDTACLFLYWAVQGPGLAWPATWQVGVNAGVAWAASYGGVDTTTPFVTHVTGVPRGSGTSWSSPMLFGVAAGNMIVATFGDYANILDGGPPPEWSLPTPWNSRSTNLSDGIRRSAIVGDLLLDAPMTPIQVIGTAVGGALPPSAVTAGLIALKAQ